MDTASPAEYLFLPRYKKRILQGIYIAGYIYCRVFILQCIYIAGYLYCRVFILQGIYIAGYDAASTHASRICCHAYRILEEYTETHISAQDAGLEA